MRVFSRVFRLPRKTAPAPNRYEGRFNRASCALGGLGNHPQPRCFHRCPPGPGAPVRQPLEDGRVTAEAITNVLDNAVKYTPNGGVVGLKITEYPSYLRLDISDNGIGIPEEEQAKIFGRFYRGKQSAGVDGVGIGLYLTRDIVNKQNGYIKVASDENGSTFSLFLKK